MPSVYPPGTAKKVPAGSDLIFQIHYTPIGKIRTDRSRVGLIFAKGPGRRTRPSPSASPSGDFLIPAAPGQRRRRLVVHPPAGRPPAQLHAPHAPARQGLRVHGHLSRQPAEVLLSVPAYDFGWQSYYTLAEPRRCRRGRGSTASPTTTTRTKNPSNPDPTQAVRWGDQTFEEMMIGYIDVDLPLGSSISQEPRRRSEVSPAARATFRAVGAFSVQAPRPRHDLPATSRLVEDPAHAAILRDPARSPRGLPRGGLELTVDRAGKPGRPRPSAPLAPFEYLIGRWKGQACPGTIPRSSSGAGPRLTRGPGRSRAEGRSD